MNNIFSNLKNHVLALAKDNLKLQSIPKEDFREIVQTELKCHKNFIQAFATISPNDRKAFYDKYSTNIAASKVESSDVHLKYRNALTGKAKSEEDRGFLGSLHMANGQMVKVLEEILKRFDTFFEKDTVDLFNTRVSSVMLLGILRSSYNLSQFSSFLWTQVIRLASDPDASIPKYRSVFLVGHYNEVASTVTDLCAGTGMFNFVREVDGIKKNQMDLVLMASGGGMSFLDLINPSRFGLASLNIIGPAIPFLNVFRWAGEKWDDFVRNRYRRMEQDVRWLQNHVALLKLELTEVNKDDPKYRELEKIIHAYDDMITDLDAKINRYMEED